MAAKPTCPAKCRKIGRAATTFGGSPRSLALMLVVAVGVSACGNAAIGPVDHECHGNPARSQGSGCEDSP